MPSFHRPALLLSVVIEDRLPIVHLRMHSSHLQHTAFGLINWLPSNGISPNTKTIGAAPLSPRGGSFLCRRVGLMLRRTIDHLE